MNSPYPRVIIAQSHASVIEFLIFIWVETATINYAWPEKFDRFMVGLLLLVVVGVFCVF